ARADFGTRFDPAEWRTGAQQSDHWKRTLLPARRERPCRRTAFARVADVSSVYARDWPPKTREPPIGTVGAPPWSLSSAADAGERHLPRKPDEAEMVPTGSPLQA